MINGRRLILTITREEIEALDIGPALAFINDAMKQPRANEGRLSLSVTGYAKGERIQPENRKVINNYFNRLCSHFDGWFHLCSRWDNTLRMLFLATTPLSPTKGTELTFELWNLREFISKHNRAMSKLHKELDIPEKTTAQVQKLMQAYFDNFFLKLKEEESGANHG